MSTHTITKLYNTPQIAEPRERTLLQVGLGPLTKWADLWTNPDKYRSNQIERHSLDILA
jgi:hypothetical protein